MTKLEQAFNLFDAYNKQDPSEIIWNGQHYPAEYFYAIKLYERVKDLDPEELASPFTRLQVPTYWTMGNCQKGLS